MSGCSRHSEMSDSNVDPEAIRDARVLRIATGTAAREEIDETIGVVVESPLAIEVEGVETYTLLCSACHKMDERYVGPALRDITERRTPEFVMNMMLNPEGMVAEHPEVRALLAQYAVPMANQNLTEEQARAVLEYLRDEATRPAGS